MALPIRSSSLAIRGSPRTEIGNLVVPENRAKPNGRWLKLPVSESPARGHHGAADPVVVIGYSGITEDRDRQPRGAGKPRKTERPVAQVARERIAGARPPWRCRSGRRHWLFGDHRGPRSATSWCRKTAQNRTAGGSSCP